MPIYRELLASLDELSEAEIEKLWVDEAIRRDEELDTGRARAYPADEVFARVRARRKSADHSRSMKRRTVSSLLRPETYFPGTAEPQIGSQQELVF